MSRSQTALRLGRTCGLLGQQSQAASTSGRVAEECGEWFKRGYATEASTSEGQQARRGRKQHNPDAWRARMPEHVQKLGSKLRRADPEAYRRMRIILGYHELPENRGKLEREAPIEQVTINNLQTLRYLDLDLGYKQELLSYRLKTLNEELHGVLADPELALPKAGERKERGRAVLAGFVPAITPGGSGGSR